MNILFDFQHPVDVNFFKAAIYILKNEKHNIFLSFRPRGKLEQILRYELPDFPIYSFGNHGQNFFSKLLFNLLREKELFSFYKKNNIHLTCGFGPLTTISSKIYGIPSLAFEDDFEYKINFYYAKFFATRHIIPKIFPVKGKNIYYYNGYKELAYLHPKYFKPTIASLKEYSLIADEYIFIRQIANISLNYKNKNNYLIDIINTAKSYGKKIVLSLEDKSLVSKFEKECIILNEPVKDINSILAFAALAISTGDTMAREASLFGTPTIYTGGRKMIIHNELYKIGIMFNEYEIEKILNRIKYILDNSLQFEKKKLIINKLIDNKWDNMTEIILKHVYNYIGKV